MRMNSTREPRDAEIVTSKKKTIFLGSRRVEIIERQVFFSQAVVWQRNLRENGHSVSQLRRGGRQNERGAEGQRGRAIRYVFFFGGLGLSKPIVPRKIELPWLRPLILLGIYFDYI